MLKHILAYGALIACVLSLVHERKSLIKQLFTAQQQLNAVQIKLDEVTMPDVEIDTNIFPPMGKLNE